MVHVPSRRKMKTTKTRWGLPIVCIATAAAACGGAGSKAATGAPTTLAPAPPCTPSGAQLQITAAGRSFDTACLAVKAHTPFTVALTNDDTTPHNFAIFVRNPVLDPTTTRLGGATSSSEVVEPGTTATYNISGLPPGAYFFHCDIHPFMNGTFVVTG